MDEEIGGFYFFMIDVVGGKVKQTLQYAVEIIFDLRLSKWTFCNHFGKEIALVA
jgi:hypothetical protein